MSVEEYFQGVPARFRDLSRSWAQRHIQLQLPGSGRESAEEIKVFEIETVVWATK
jgi:hypothetical protein